MEDLIVGKHAVLEALQAGRTLHKVWVSKQAQRNAFQSLIAMCQEAGVAVQFVDKRKLDQLAEGLVHQGVVAQAASQHYAELDDLFASAEARGEEPFFIVLDEIEDPHNLGSILRTAECTGVHGVIIPKRRAVGLTAAVSKTSAGAVEYVPVVRVTNMTQTLKTLKERGLWITGADAEATQTAFEADLVMPLAVVIGNESKGLGRLVKETCDFLVKLPMQGRISSLNASVAAGVFMYEILRQRQMAQKNMG